ncbi:MAG TPA: hypothetical protein VLE73_03950 [Candidatus Saccharimonadales bacterium]|nr:hypothetical protein [Candidatus Saccharimonadales bacterium]
MSNKTQPTPVALPEGLSEEALVNLTGFFDALIEMDLERRGVGEK